MPGMSAQERDSSSRFFPGILFSFGSAGFSLSVGFSSGCREPGLLSGCSVRASHFSGLDSVEDGP